MTQPLANRSVPGVSSDPGTGVAPLSGTVAVAGVLIVAAILRFALLGRHSIWNDEAFVVWVTSLPGEAIPHALTVRDTHPPLYYLFMHAWVGVAGTSEAALRLPSACFSLLSVLLTYLLMRRFSSHGVSLLAATVVAVSPVEVMAGQEARMHALLGLLTLASTLALIAAVERRGALRWAIYVGLAVMLALTQYLGVLVLLAHGLWIAGCERRHLRAWSLSMLAAGALYAPWIPSLWSQLVMLHGWDWWRNHVTAKTPGDLLGLFSFGGSLFGMASYFGGGTVGVVEQGAVLLPFLLVLWRGAASLGTDRRSLAALGLPLAIPIGVMFGLSAATGATFYPRWFSFLVPFYAMLLARGCYDVAERFSAYRKQTFALVLAGLLSYSVPVLGRYYFDPRFWPYRWRDAADAVRAHVEPGDFFLYVGDMARIGFTYYFRDAHPSKTLIPIEAVPGRARAAGFAEREARQMASRYPRTWLVVTIPFTPSMQQRLLPALASAYRTAGGGDFAGASVYLLVANPARGR